VKKSRRKNDVFKEREEAGPFKERDLTKPFLGGRRGKKWIAEKERDHREGGPSILKRELPYAQKRREEKKGLVRRTHPE